MYEYKCEIDRVIDGDTVDVHIDLGFDIILKHQRIRLNGIDTPEVRTSDLTEKKYGLLAKEFVIEFLKDKEVKLVTTEYNPIGKFGRILGDLYVNDVSLCSLLLENHLAVEYHGQSKEDIQNEHLLNRELINGTYLLG